MSRLLFLLGLFWPVAAMGFEMEINGLLLQRLEASDAIDPRVISFLRAEADCMVGTERWESIGRWRCAVYPLACRIRLFCRKEPLFETRTYAEGVGKSEALARRDAILRTVDALWPTTEAWALALSRSLVLGELRASLQELERTLDDISTAAEVVSRPSDQLLDVLSRALKQIEEEGP